MGHVAAKLSKTRAKHVAAITGGAPVELTPATLAFTNGFIFGARQECRDCKVLSYPFAFDELNRTRAVADAWAVVTGATTSPTGIATSTPDFTLLTAHPVLPPAKELLQQLADPGVSGALGNRQVIAGPWGDALGWGFDAGAAPGALNPGP
jgi:hypothetical protein